METCGIAPQHRGWTPAAARVASAVALCGQFALLVGLVAAFAS